MRKARINPEERNIYKSGSIISQNLIIQVLWKGDLGISLVFMDIVLTNASKNPPKQGFLDANR